MIITAANILNSYESKEIGRDVYKYLNYVQKHLDLDLMKMVTTYLSEYKDSEGTSYTSY